MASSRHFQTKTWRSNSGSCSREGLATREYYHRSQVYFVRLESTISHDPQNILGTLFLTPEPPHKSIYYVALITDLCKLSPQTIGPAVGKSIRRLYGLLADGLDVEVAKRLTDWFSVHLSNFNFQWVWAEWSASH